MNKIKEAFNDIKVSDDLKEKTVYNIISRGSKHTIRYVLAMTSFVLIVGFSAYYFYFTPVVTIALDINPSIELSINRLNRVIETVAYNDDGSRLLNELVLENYNYNDAIETILNSKEIETLLENDETLMIGVIGQDDHKCNEVLAVLEDRADDHHNMHCYKGEEEIMDHAKNHHSSYGKYQSYLILKDLGYDIDLEEVNSMTMKEIMTLIEEKYDVNDYGDYFENSHHSDHHH